MIPVIAAIFIALYFALFLHDVYTNQPDRK